MHKDVYILNNLNYDILSSGTILPEILFSIISPGDTIIIKPNWVLESHQILKNEWEQVITHPSLITAVIKQVIKCLKGRGKIIITDGPELNADFNMILARQPINYWNTLLLNTDIILEIIDLREELFIQDKNVTIKKIKLPCDPRGKVIVNLIGGNSEFFLQKKSPKGYFGGGSNIEETNKAHDGTNNFYSISRTVIEADVVINLPKLKTHKKSGITASLKNLVGINTYRNFLPHNMIGTPIEFGDQFPSDKINAKLESFLMPMIHQYILTFPILARLFSPMISLGKLLFGDNTKTLRGGSWYGNDTIWRMIIDINKALFYANPNGSLKENKILEMKKYICIVDAIIAGEGDGPKAPDKVNAGIIIAGSNPVAVDTVCAKVMDFDFNKIPSINNAYLIKQFPIANFNPEDIKIHFKENTYNLSTIPESLIKKFKAHRGWIGHIEL